MPNHAIIVAAGSGRRFGGLKQFFMVHDRPLVLHAIDRFESEPLIDAITVVVPASKIRHIKKLTKAWNLKKIRHIVAGGRQRQDSVFNGLRRIREVRGCIVVHDGVRPVFPKGLIRKGITLCRTYKAVVFGSRIRETIKEVKNRRVIRTVPRKNLFLIKTPQFFECHLLKRAYREADLTTNYTDDAALCESLNIPVYLFPDDRLNLKITRKSDINLIRHAL